jgi:hypothetical protein
MRRTVTLKDGSRYTCKAAYLSYKPKVEIDRRHAVAAFFPNVPKSSLIKIVNPNAVNTDPDQANPKHRYDLRPLDASHEVWVRGLFYVRTNHPASKTSRAKEVIIDFNLMLFVSFPLAIIQIKHSRFYSRFSEI